MGSKTTTKVHVMRLHQDPSNDYDIFDKRWLMVNISIADTNIQNGDVFYFPELNTGAGELEAVRIGLFSEDNKIILLKCGIEYPEFPIEVQNLVNGLDIEAEKLQQKLRHQYERAICNVLNENVPGLTLCDIMGGESVVDEFWESDDPIMTHHKEFNSSVNAISHWEIPYDQCTLIKII